uniref:Uncharacterized protein n=1 Tax=Arundo donax TaxID=35708 RepID=A0A0A9AJK8_ARUDO
MLRVLNYMSTEIPVLQRDQQYHQRDQTVLVPA